MIVIGVAGIFAANYIKLKGELQMINIKGLDKSEVLLKLWENSYAQGMSWLSLPNKTMTKKDFEEIVNESCDLYFDYVYGKVIKCDLSGDEFDPRLYDRDCGVGKAQRAIDQLKGE